jgi:hypothetical protein
MSNARPDEKDAFAVRHAAPVAPPASPVMGVRDTAIAAYLIHKLHGKVALSRELQDEIYAAVAEFQNTEAGRLFATVAPASNAN